LIYAFTEEFSEVVITMYAFSAK